MTFDFQEKELIEKLKKLKPKKVLIQLPEGIKKNAIEVSKIMESLGIEAIFSGETCWGACSLAIEEAKNLGVDLIIHYGHAKFIKTNFPTIYVEVKDILNLNFLLKKSLEFLKNHKTIGLSCSIQHKHDLEKIKNFYEKHSKKVIFSKKKGLVACEGHILGCQYEGLKEIQKNVDAFIVIGNNFHFRGASLALNKPVIFLDVYNDKIKEGIEEKEKILKQRFFSIEKLRKAKKVGIITELKPGQKFGSAEYLYKKLKKSGKIPIRITMNEITPEKIMNFYDIDAFVELGCPRIAIDDFEKYSKPILTFKEALVALNEKSWKSLLKEGII